MTERKGALWDVIEGRAPIAPAAATLGWKLVAIDPDEGTIQVEFQARQEFLNPAGSVQGGFLAAMLDDTMGPALVATLAPELFATTVELKVNYIRPARVGRLVASGRVVHRGRSICFLAGELHDDSGALIATATATARLVPMP